MSPGAGERFRSLPSVDVVLVRVVGDAPHAVAAAAARVAIDQARREIREGRAAPGTDWIVARARALLADRERSRLTKVINATGVLLHTNLGRAPMGEKQMDAVARVATGYSNLEFDLISGKRGSRYAHTTLAITEVTGAEAALVVNNNAAAVLLMLAGLCSGREAIISRGELVEIGGEFRIPDVMAAAGVDLVEVGTTNRTNIGDYERAISPRTAAILKVHPSNYRVVGFASSVAAQELARLARGRGVMFLHDLGSGLIESPRGAAWSHAEPTVRGALEDGADLITFSGDKLLGGPQAGIIAGRRDLIEGLMRHPLLRALRVDKMRLAALDATLRAHAAGTPEELPLWKMALTSVDELEARARNMAARLTARLDDDFKVEPVPSEALLGGGSTPGEEIPSWSLAITHGKRTVAELERLLRAASPPVIPRVQDERLMLDLRTVQPADDEALIASALESLA
ncbi:MAG: L-seryl-tRNA(Ser) seleniumtransferase [Actinomycetota bacterium]|nr:L-seryl-tRNA(Ser) seleniumtransferase [Actinomycetota bacterium]